VVVKTSVIYLMKDKFQFYSGYDGKIFEFRFVPEIVRDLDIINGGLLENLVKVFVSNNKIPPSGIVFVLAENAYFSKDFTASAQQKTGSNSAEVTKEFLRKDADEFIEHVPFDNVVSKTLPIKDGIKVCATNKDFYESIAIAFEHLGFTVESVVPGVVLGNGLSLRPTLDQAMASMILQKVSGVKEYNLLGQQVFQPQVKQEAEEVDEVELERLQTKKPNKKRLYGMVGVLFSLVIVLVVMFAQTMSPSEAPKSSVDANTPQPTAIINSPVVLPTLLPTTAPDTAPVSSEIQSLTVQIVNASDSATVAQDLQGVLDTYKFKSVSIQTQSPIGSSGSLVSFGPNVSQNVRNAVTGALKEYENNIIVQDQQIGTYDISIVIGQ
jgi:hypothetical protein